MTITETATLNELIDHILDTHHACLRRELPRLRGLLGQILAAHREKKADWLEPVAETFDALAAELEAHMFKEERILFPFVRAMEEAVLEGRTPPRPPFGSVRGPISVMEAEHSSAKQALERMRSLTGGYTLPEGGCETCGALLAGLAALDSDLTQHIHLEDDILFPRAAELERA